jgi:hypothetical protein
MLHPIVILLLTGVCAQESTVRVELPGAPEDRPRALRPADDSAERAFGCARRITIDPPRSAEGFAQWQFWWEVNRHGLLDLRRRRSPQDRALRDVREEVLPALLEALDDPDAEIASAAAIAIGRVTPRDDPSGPGLDALMRALGSPSPFLRESAALALGILGDPGACESLVQTMTDTAPARGRPIDRGVEQARLRGRAALSLGLIGDAGAITHLEQVVATEPRTSLDVIACAITALGLFDVQQREIVSFLLAQLPRDDLDCRVLAQVPTAIARLGSAGRHTVPLLLEMTGSGARDPHTVRSAALALGKLATVDQTEVVDRLRTVAIDHEDAQTRHLAFMALAEVAGRDRPSAASLETCRRTLEFFLEQTAAPQPPTSLPGPLSGSPWSRDRSPTGRLAPRPRCARHFCAAATRPIERRWH